MSRRRRCSWPGSGRVYQRFEGSGEFRHGNGRTVLSLAVPAHKERHHDAINDYMRFFSKRNATNGHELPSGARNRAFVGSLSDAKQDLRNLGIGSR